MIKLEIEQNTPEWYAARLGMPTASSFNKIITSKGALSTQRTKYLYKLAGERILGYPEESYQNSHMERGSELEAEARNLFEVISETEVDQIGFCYLDERKTIGCSPDGLIGENEILEIKAPSLAVHVEYLIKGKLPTTYFQQVMGSLYVTGREKANFFSYYPGMKPLHIIVERDEIFIAKLAKALDDFVVELDETHKLLIENGEE